MACYSCNTITKVIFRYSRTQQTHLTQADDCILLALNLSTCLLYKGCFVLFFEDFNMSSLSHIVMHTGYTDGMCVPF